MCKNKSRIENYIQKLENWDKVCDEIIEASNSIGIMYIAQELKNNIKNELIYYKNE